MIKAVKEATGNETKEEKIRKANLIKELNIRWRLNIDEQ